MHTNELADALELIGKHLAPPGETTTLFIGPDTADTIRQALCPLYIPAQVNEYLRYVIDQEAERIDKASMPDAERAEAISKMHEAEKWLERFTTTPSQVEPGPELPPMPTPPHDVAIPCYCKKCGWSFSVEQPPNLDPDIYGAKTEWFCPHCGSTAHATEPEPVDMPPKTDLKCGCKHAGIMAGCPVHDASAPSPFNIHPGGNPAL